MKQVIRRFALLFVAVPVMTLGGVPGAAAADPPPPITVVCQPQQTNAAHGDNNHQANGHQNTNCQQNVYAPSVTFVSRPTSVSVLPDLRPAVDLAARVLSPR